MTSTFQNNHKRVTKHQHAQIFELRNSEEKITWSGIEKLVGVSASHCRKIFVNNTPYDEFVKKEKYRPVYKSLVNVKDLDFSSEENNEFFCIKKWGKSNKN